MNFLTVIFPDIDFQREVLNAMTTLSDKLSDSPFDVTSVNIAKLVFAKYVENQALKGGEDAPSLLTYNYIESWLEVQVTQRIIHTDKDVGYALDLHTGQITHIGY